MNRQLGDLLKRLMPGGGAALLMARVVSIDRARKTAEVLPEGFTESWRELTYRPVIRDDDEGVSFDPVVDSWVLVQVDVQGRKRIISTERFDEMHIVSEAADVRIDLTEKLLTIQITDGAKVAIDGDKVIINDGSHPAMRGDVTKSYLDTHVHAGPSGPPVAPLPDNALNQKILID